MLMFFPRIAFGLIVIQYGCPMYSPSPICVEGYISIQLILAVILYNMLIMSLIGGVAETVVILEIFEI